MKKILLMTFIIMMITANIAIGISIVDVACGNNHTVLLAEDGTVWTMGDNSKGQCGPTNVGRNLDKPTQILYIPKMQKIAAAGDITMLLDVDGIAYELTSEGTLIKTGIENVVDVKIGNLWYSNDYPSEMIYTTGYIYAMLTSEGIVYTKGIVGRNLWYDANGMFTGYIPSIGRTTTGATNLTSWDIAYEKVGAPLSNIVEIALTNDGLECIDSFGYIYYGIPSSYSGVKVDSVYGTTVLMSKSTEPYTLDEVKRKLWQSGLFYANSPYTGSDVYYYSLTSLISLISQDLSDVSIPLDIGTLTYEDILYLATNQYNTFSGGAKDILVTLDGKVYEGSGEKCCRKGGPKYNTINTYKMYYSSTSKWWQNNHIGDVKIVKAANGANHTILIDEDGNVYSYGDNTYGQLGLASYKEIEVVTFENMIYYLLGNGKSVLSSRAMPTKVAVPTLIESLQEIVPSEQSSLAYITTDARVWIEGIANFSLMFEVKEDMTLRNTNTTLHEIFTNGALNLKVYKVYENGMQELIPTAQGLVYNIYENGVNITQTITPNFVFKSGKLYQLECGIGGVGVFTDRYGETRRHYLVKFEGMNASKIKDGVVTQMRSSVDIAKFALKVFVTDLANLT